MIAPDEKTFEYIKGREFTPKNNDWLNAMKYWSTLKTDEDAVFDKEIHFDGNEINPMITFGTNPGMGIGISKQIPKADSQDGGIQTFKKSLNYMDFNEGEGMIGKNIDFVFLGSCTNGRIEDFREFTKIVKGKKKAPNVTAWLVPGSHKVEKAIEEEGLLKILNESGLPIIQQGTILLSEDMYDLIANINANVDNVSASAFNTVVAKTVGTGIVRENQVAIQIGAIGASGDAWYQPAKQVTLERSDSMEEMVANINAAFYENEVVATINDDGKLVLSNDDGATIRVADISGTDNAYDGATGFLVTTDVTFTSGVPDGYGTGVQGFLKLSSTDESPVEIEAGNTGLSSPGAVGDIQNIGFNMTEEDPTGNSYTVTGTRLVDTSIAATLSKHATTEQADLTLNGVEIYDATLSAASNTFQGKLDLINAFSDESGVVASAYYEKTFSTANWTLVKGDTFDLNGSTITVSATVASTVTAINNATANTGITAETDGSNVILKGDGVQNVTFVQNDYTVSTNNNQAESRRSADTADQTQRISFASTDIVAGRVLTLKFDTTNATDPDGTGNAVAGLSIAANSSLTLGYTVQSGDSAGDVATAFHDLILNKIHDSVPTIAVSEGQYVDLTVATSSLVFLSAFDLGEATITIGVSQTATANRIFYDANADGGATANYTDHAAIRLQSSDLSPISIEFAETGNEIGLLENNVGDTTWDANSATFQTTGQAGVAVSGLSVSTSAGAEEALTVLSTAIQDISDMRSSLGAIENRLGHTVSNLSNVVENTSAAQSRIQDADFALEAAALARAQILQQAGTAMLAQANAAPQSVLSLLG